MMKMTSYVAALMVTTGLLTACGSEIAESHGDARPLAEQISALIDGASFEDPLFRSVIDATPQTTLILDGAIQEPYSDLLVVGKVTAVKGDFGFSWPKGPQIAGEASNRQQSAFNSAEAEIVTLSVTVAVEDFRELHPTTEERPEVRFGLSLLAPVDLDAVSKGLVGRHVVALLQSNEKTPFDYDRSLYGVLWGGEFLGFVDEQGQVEFPASEFDVAPEGGPLPIPLGELFRDPTTVELKTVNGQVERAD